MSADSTTVILGTLDRAAPTLGLSIASRQRRDGLAVDEDCLCVVSGSVVEFVCGSD